ncbi:hypothetical protein ACXR2W_05280 [Leucobacter sp. HY1908]
MQKKSVGIALALSGLLLAGCASQAPAKAPAPEPDTNPSASAETDAKPTESTPSEGQFSIEHITSCDQIEAVVAPFIEGLVPLDDNVVDEWGVSCGWDMAEDETNVANGRSVSVGMATVEQGTPKPDPSMVLEMEGASLVEDPWLADNGGIGYSLQTAVAIAGASTTTIWVPGVETSITASAVGDMSTIDGPAGLKIVQALLAK